MPVFSKVAFPQRPPMNTSPPGGQGLNALIGRAYGLYGGQTPGVAADPRVQAVVASQQQRPSIKDMAQQFLQGFLTNITAQVAETPEGKRVIDQEKNRQVGKFITSPAGIATLIAAAIVVIVIARR
jgi:hypothetical protein